MDGGSSLEGTARERVAPPAMPSLGPRGVSLIGRGWRARLAPLVLGGLVLAACATRLPVNATPIYPSYPFPTVPLELAGTPAAAEHERAWGLLQAGDLDAAEQGFSAALRSTPGFHPSGAGLGFVGLARGDADAAVTRFDQALIFSPAYLPALLGRGEALLVGDRTDEAIQSFEAALRVEPGLTSLRQRVAELRFAGLMDQVTRAREASAAGRDDEARAAYERVLAASPDSGFLHVELAAVHRRQGDTDAALEQLDRAIELDADVAEPWLMMSEIYLGRGDLDRAEQALRRAGAIEPSETIARGLADLATRRFEAGLPPQFREIEAAEAITRGQLAALVGIRFEPLLAGAAANRSIIITDARDHWGFQWVLAVARTRIMEADTNYRFQPERLVTRAELAQVAVRVLGLSGGDPTASVVAPEASFSDLAPDNLNYPAASQAVAAGVMQPLEQNAFRPGRQVSGVEAIAAIGQLRVLLGEGVQ